MNLQTALTPVHARYPDFICIGAQKAGTTWFHQMLRRHPAIWMPPVKELHYFDAVHLKAAETFGDRKMIDELVMLAALRSARTTLDASLALKDKLQRLQLLGHIGERSNTDSWYGTIFLAAGRGQLCGEITPAYALLPDKGVKHILKLQPRAKIVFILRDPIERAWSELRMTKKQRDVTAASELRRVIGGTIFLARSDYMATITRFLKHVSKDNFMNLYFDDILDSPENVLIKTCEFLGVEYDLGRFRRLEKVVHQGPKAEMGRELYSLLRDRLAPYYEALRELDNPIVQNWWNKHYGSR